MVTVATSGPLNVLPLAALCEEPLLAAIATVCELGAVEGAALVLLLLLLLPQPVRKAGRRQMNAKMNE